MGRAENRPAGLGPAPGPARRTGASPVLAGALLAGLIAFPAGAAELTAASLTGGGGSSGSGGVALFGHLSAIPAGAAMASANYESSGGLLAGLTTALDDQPPVVVAPADISVAAVDAGGTPASDPTIAAFLAGATASDNDVVVSLGHDAPSPFPLGITTVTFSALDAAGNSGSAQASVTISDQQAPVLTLNGAAEVVLSVGDSYDEAGASASDNVDGDLSAQVSITGSVNTALVSLYTLTYQVSDSAGNAAAALTRAVTVQDAQAADGNCGADLVQLSVRSYAMGESITCTAGSRLEAGGAVTVRSGAEVTYSAPMVVLRGGFSARAGSQFRATTAVASRLQGEALVARSAQSTAGIGAQSAAGGGQGSADPIGGVGGTPETTANGQQPAAIPTLSPWALLASAWLLAALAAGRLRPSGSHTATPSKR